MFIRNHGMLRNRILRAPDGEGAGGGSVPPAAGASGEHPASGFQAPWSGKTDMYVIGEGDKAQPWYSGITEEPVRDYIKTKGYKNPDEVARAAWSANKLLAERGDPNSIIAPKADATPEEWNNFYAKLGRPESPDKYPEFKQPDGVEVDQNLLKFGKELFFDMGLPPQKAQEAMDKWNKFAGEASTAQIEAARVQNDADLTALQTTWGPELDANKAAGLRVMQSLKLAPELMAKIEGATGSAAVVELLAKIGRASAEGSFKGGNTNQGDPNNPDLMTPEQAAAKITQLQTDEDFQKKYKNPDDAVRGPALALMEKLFAKAGNATKK